MQRAKEKERGRQSKQVKAVQVRVSTQVVPETQKEQEKEEKVGEILKKEVELTNLLEIFAGIINPAIYFVFTVVYFTVAIMSM